MLRISILLLKLFKVRRAAIIIYIISIKLLCTGW